MLVIEHVDLSTKRRTTIGACENNLELAYAIIRQFLRQFLQLEYDDRLPRFVEYGDLNNGGIKVDYLITKCFFVVKQTAVKVKPVKCRGNHVPD